MPNFAISFSRKILPNKSIKPILTIKNSITTPIKLKVSKTEVLGTFSLIAGVMLFFILKIGLILLLGSILRVKDIAKLGLFFSFLFDRALGFFLFPLLIALYFFTFNISSFVMLIVTIVFVVLLLLKLFWLWKIGTNAFGLSHFYIFLYLCTLEISPLLFLGKGVVY